jgi:hypothetical protein
LAESSPARQETGIKEAIFDYKALAKNKDSRSYYFSERECNSLSYYLLRNYRTDDAIQLFKFNTEQFPTSGNWQHGRGLSKSCDKINVLAQYKKAFELDQVTVMRQT